MAYETVITWNIASRTPEVTHAIDLYAEELTQQGKTDGIVVTGDNDQGITKTRTWIDLESAQTWVNFVEQYNPISSVIKEIED
jgi:hypothetical protein